MTHKKLSRNAPCPCGSGRKYKHCCWGKGFEWVEDEAGAVFRSTPLSPEVRVAGHLSRLYPVRRDVPRTHPEDWRKNSRRL
jgi:hypothetical protein